LPSIKHIDQSVDGVQLSIGGDSSKAEIDQATDARDTFQNRFSLNLEERKELESLRNRLARLESATMGNADDFARATTKVAELENAQKEHTTAMKVKDAILHDQGELIADLRRKLGQYERDNDALVKDVEHCEHQLREAEADIADLNDQLLAKKEIEEQLRSLLLEVQTVDYHIGSGDSLDRSIQLRSVTGNSVGWTDQSLDAMKGKDTEFTPNSADSMNRTDSDIDMGTPREEIPSRSQNTPEKVSVKEVCSACAKHVEEVAATREQLRLATERAEKSAEEDTVLREQMNRIMSEKTSLTTKQETLQAQLEEMRLQYATAKEGSSRLKTDKKYLTKQCAQLEANLKARDAEAVRLQGVAEQLRAALILSSTYSLTSMSSKTPNSLQQEPHPTP
jgi:chromosome segregation ATPase